MYDICCKVVTYIAVTRSYNTKKYIKGFRTNNIIIDSRVRVIQENLIEF